MRSDYKHILFLFCFLQTGSLLTPAAAQISSSSADFSDTLEYPVFPARDLFFVFHAPSFGTPVTGSLTAAAPAGTPPFDFSWSKYNPASNSFDPPFNTGNGANSTVNDLEDGCYRVHITSSDLDTLFRAWVFSDDSNVEVEKGPDGKIMPYRYTCDYLILNGVAEADKMIYYDLSTGLDTLLANTMTVKWTSDDPDFEISGDNRLYVHIGNEPPYSRPPVKDTRFTLTATDNFNLTRADDVLYESVHVRAGFTMWYEDRSDPESDGIWTESESPEEESPMEVRFINTSENGVEFEWNLVDSAKTGEEARFFTYDVNDSVVYTYYIPGYYYPDLIAYSEGGCVDSFPLTINPEIHVVPSELDVPNVFTPNGDGVNDYFVVRSKSLKAFRVTIFSATGAKVYEYEHAEGRFEWEGWDGTMLGKGKNFVAPGVYYYVIDALGWDASTYRKIEPYTGFVYIFREAE